MTHTEEQAKEKWCPFSQIASMNQYGCNDYQFNVATCCASNCMMWQWDGKRGFCGLTGRR